MHKIRLPKYIYLFLVIMWCGICCCKLVCSSEPPNQKQKSNTESICLREVVDETPTTKYKPLCANSSDCETESDVKKLITTPPIATPVAKCEYKNPDCVSVSKNDKISIIERNKEDPEWTFVKNLNTQETGYIPTSLICYQCNLQNEEWYFDDVTRQDVENVLIPRSAEEGTFLIRKALPQAGCCFVLSIRTNSPRNRRHVKHYKIHMDATSKMFYCSRDYMFHSLAELVEIFSEKPFHEQLILKKPCPNNDYLKPVIYSLSPKYSLTWNIPRSELSNFATLNKGKFGEVFKAKWKNFKTVAVKINGLHKNEKNQKATLDEINIMRKMRHKNIIQIYGMCCEQTPYLIVEEYMVNGDLLHYVKSNNLEKRQKHYVSYQVASGMKYLEDHRVIHRDLAARNVFVGEDLQIKIGDFGLSRTVFEKDEVYVMVNTKCVPIKWTAPEALFTDQYTTKSDVWAFGILLLEIYSNGEEPFAKFNSHQAYMLLREGQLPGKPEKMCDEMYEFAKQCWAYVPEDRPTFKQLLEELEDVANEKDEAYYYSVGDVEEIIDLC